MSAETTDSKTMINELLDFSIALDEWERDFIESISEPGYELTEPEFAKLWEIHNNFFG